jgi:hypothetical protein
MNTTLRALIAVLTIAGAHCSHTAVAQTRGGHATVAGAWNVSLHGDHVMPVGLELRQDGTKVTGTMVVMERNIEVEGEFTNARLSISGTMPAGGSEAASQFKMTATLKDDGTLAGEVDTRHGPMKMTAERLTKRL